MGMERKEAAMGVVMTKEVDTKMEEIKAIMRDTVVDKEKKKKRTNNVLIN